MVNLGFVTGFATYLTDFGVQAKWRFVTWLTRPYPGTSVQAGIFLCDAPLKPIPVTYQPPRMYARTQVRAYEPSDVLSLGLHAGITDAACKAQNFNLTSGFWPGDLVWLRAMADASVVAAQRQQAEAQKALVRLIPAY